MNQENPLAFWKGLIVAVPVSVALWILIVWGIMEIL